MKITRNNVDDLNAVLTVVISPDDYQENINKTIKEQAKKAKLPGYRPGMVPPAHIKKMYGKGILVEEINKTLSDAVNNYIKQNEIEILGQPLPKEDDTTFNWEFDEQYTFNYELGIAPPVTLEFTSKDKITQYVIKIDEETLDARIKNLRRSYGKMTNPEIVEEGDVIYGEFEQLQNDGSVLENGVKVTSSLRLDLIQDDVFKAILLGLKKDDVVDSFDLVNAVNNEDQLRRILKLDDEGAIIPQSAFKLTVKNINRLEESDLNEDFYKKVFGEENTVATEEEFREKIKGELEAMMVQDADRKLAADLYKYGTEKNVMVLPDEFLKRWLKATNKDLTDEELDKGYDDFAKNLKWTLVENKIIKDNKIEIKYEDVFEAAKQRLDAQFRMYSPTPIAEDQLAQYAAQYLKESNNANQVFDEVKSNKVFGHLKTIITLEQKDIDYKDFQELS